MKTAKTTAKKKVPARKQTRKRSRKPLGSRPYVEPKTTAKLGISCATLVAGEKCDKAVLGFNCVIGWKDHIQGFVGDEHIVSSRVEMLAVRKAALAGAAN